ncbi:hypothetical protein D9M68_991610 [compost metagenome]
MMRKYFCGLTFSSRAKRFTWPTSMPCMPDSASTKTALTQGQPELQSAPPKWISVSPKIQVAIMAGFMMPLSRRRSITLKVSDWTEPFSACV